jgi:hypothetical protein
MIELFFGVSLLANAFLGWYGYNLLKDRVQLVDILTNFSPLVKEYEGHLEALTKMDLYFGEPTIMSLIDHTKEIRLRLDDLLQSVEVEETIDDEKE